VWFKWNYHQGSHADVGLFLQLEKGLHQQSRVFGESRVYARVASPLVQSRAYPSHSQRKHREQNNVGAAHPLEYDCSEHTLVNQDVCWAALRDRQYGLLHLAQAGGGLVYVIQRFNPRFPKDLQFPKDGCDTVEAWWLKESSFPRGCWFTYTTSTW